MSQTIEQRRATSAWKAVKDVGSLKEFKAYERLLQGTSAAIHTAGLGQTIAFYVSRADRNEYGTLLMHIAAWILPSNGTNEDAKPGDKKLIKDLIEDFQSCDMQTYRQRASEILAYVGWLKRFASARLLLTEDNEDADE